MVKIENNEPILMNQEYILVTSHFLYQGGDGYTVFHDPEIRMIGELDSAPMIDNIIKNFFKKF